MVQPPVLDSVIVGAGFAGLYTLWKLRELGFSTKILEMGSDIGGTWYHNRYPGARVDSEIPIYQLSMQKAWSSFEWSEKFPAREEILRYFEHLDKTLDLRKDIEFNTLVVSATFDESRHLWEVKTSSGSTILATHLNLCIGFSARKYSPTFPGQETFKGKIFHSANWPKNQDADLTAKRVAVIGTGASGIQIIQEIAPIVDHLTVYQRTPNFALPMRQTKSRDAPFANVSGYGDIFKIMPTTFGGMSMDFTPKKWDETIPQERRDLYEKCYQLGGFNLWLSTYVEVFFNQTANDEVYAFWRDKVRQRVKNEATRDLLAPMVQPHPFGTKRPSLEQSYYEVFNQDNVDLINVKESPILEITPTGIKTADGRHVEVDVIVLATGFDTSTGGMLDISIKNGEGLTLPEKWGDGTSTFLGVTMHGFPNMYFIYGPQASTAFSNGPTCIEIQADWMIDLMVDMRAKKRTRVEAEKGAEDDWVAMVRHIWEISLFWKAESWYQGANIPGKRKEALNFAGGIPAYRKALGECKDEGYKGLQFK
ncbi:baeyer-Villiger monooxygenase [Folsomia candida]|uniref:Flavin-containing monooxygenase n=1 Tax=Folsomia candida TaxID=158441 RepID=A0A226DLM8_FOLCA|nr:baeyer-Villiger monooxygenase [Folsomia candida]OXA45116.1 Baeyer-Villiger monooxygenase [Folsomia candida]